MHSAIGRDDRVGGRLQDGRLQDGQEPFLCLAGCLVETRVIEGDANLIRNRLQYVDFLIVEGVWQIADHAQDADDLAARVHWGKRHRLNVFIRDFGDEQARVITHVPGDNHFPGTDDLPRHAMPQPDTHRCANEILLPAALCAQHQLTRAFIDQADTTGFDRDYG